MVMLLLVYRLFLLSAPFLGSVYRSSCRPAPFAAYEFEPAAYPYGELSQAYHIRREAARRGENAPRAF